jgi:adenine-specific DNA methylase
MKLPQKLIEVGFPLDASDRTLAREESVRGGHPSTSQLWWARAEVPR